jgi:hypothetical protein
MLGCWYFEIRLQFPDGNLRSEYGNYSQTEKPFNYYFHIFHLFLTFFHLRESIFIARNLKRRPPFILKKNPQELLPAGLDQDGFKPSEDYEPGV